MIGLNKTDLYVGMDVYYYPYYDKFSNAEPVKTKIRDISSIPSNNNICFVNGINGCVSTNHLSKNYYPEKKISPKKLKSKERYSKYLQSECDISFGDWLKNDYYEK